MSPGTPSASVVAARWLSGILTPLVVLAVAVGLDAVDQVAPDPLAGTAARYVPPDGHRTVLRDAAGELVVVEHARSVGVEEILTAPPSVAAAVLDRRGEQQVRTAQWWRVARIDSAGTRTVDLYRLAPEGIVQVAAWGGSIGFVFEPELLVLPAEAVAGDRWSASGSALGDGVLAYELTAAAFSATGPFTDAQGDTVPLTGGCLGVDSSVVLSAPADALRTDLVESTVWCPGRGPVWSSGTVDAEPVGQAEVRPASLAALARDLPDAEEWAESAPQAMALRAPRALSLVAADPFFGESPLGVQVSLPPLLLADGRIVAINDRGDDVHWWRRAGAELVLDASAHPGGVIVSSAVVGDLVIVSTAQRAVVAYDGLGRRVWQWRGPELVLAPAVGVPGRGGSGERAAPDVVVVDRGGQATRLDAETGAVRWSAVVDADARAPVVVAGGAVIVADERGRVSALAAVDGALQWREDIGFAENAAASSDGAAVAVQLESGEVVVLRARDGAELAAHRYPGVARDLVIAEGVVLALSDERLIAVDAASGDLLWRDEGALTLVGEGSVVAVLSDDRVRLVAVVDGSTRAEQALEPSLVSATRRALAVGSGLLIIDSDGRVQDVGLR